MAANAVAPDTTSNQFMGNGGGDKDPVGGNFSRTFDTINCWLVLYY